MNSVPAIPSEDPKELQAIILELQRNLVEAKAHFDRETGILIEQIRLLRQQMFGRKSEKMSPVPPNTQKTIFDMPEHEDTEEEAEEIVIPAHTRKKPGRRSLPEDLPREEIIHDIPEEEKICACGCMKKRIGEEVSEQLDIIPAQVRVIRHIRPKYACSNCQCDSSEGPAVSIAPVEPQIIPKSIATPGLLAYILVGKFVDHLPFYRQEGQFRRIGVDICRATMCRWAMKVASTCQVMLNLLQEELLAGFYVHADETTVQVLREPGRSPTTKSYMWVFRRGDPQHPILIFKYDETRRADVASEFLRGFKGYVQTDGYVGYDFLDQWADVRHMGCMAHARRKFTDIIKAQGKNRKKTGSADVAISYFRKLYAIEREARDKRYTPEQIYEVRQEKAMPVLEEFHDWLLKRSSQVLPKSLLGKAVSYCLAQWERLIVYIEDGNLSIDNNAAENAIRPFVLGRKNWLFAGTPEGAEASALLYSLIETAKANGHEPYSYLRYVFKKLPYATTLVEYEALLPWNLDARKLAREVVNTGV